jgi:hypothetical protein
MAYKIRYWLSLGFKARHIGQTLVEEYGFKHYKSYEKIGQEAINRYSR